MVNDAMVNDAVVNDAVLSLDAAVELTRTGDLGCSAARPPQTTLSGP